MGFACIEDVNKGLYAGNKVAVTDDFNIVTQFGLLNSRITVKKKKKKSLSLSSVTQSS